MIYQVLARKWRPRDFASLVGQEHVVRALTHALQAQRLHHAYLFTGTRGVGKTTLSRILAKALNCEAGITATPCGVCKACREIDEGRFVDYVEMDAASNRGVDEMAALLERAVYAPVDARFKVYMIDEVHMLTHHAFNSMLKTLEEPPAHVKFILATTDPQKIPVTVLSRCLQFNLKQMPAGHIVSHLERILADEGIGFETQALRLLSRAADGSMRDALSLTDQAIAYAAGAVTEQAVRGMLGALDQSYLVRLLDAVAVRDGAAVRSVADEMAARSLSFSTALQDLSSLLHRIAWAQVVPDSVLDEWPEAADVRRFAQQLTPEAVQLYYQIATIGRAELGLAPDEYAGFTMALLRMLAFGTVDVISGRVPADMPPAAGTPEAGAPGAGGGPTASDARAVGATQREPAQRLHARAATQAQAFAMPTHAAEAVQTAARSPGVPAAARGGADADEAMQERVRMAVACTNATQTSTASTDATGMGAAQTQLEGTSVPHTDDGPTDAVEANPSQPALQEDVAAPSSPQPVSSHPDPSRAGSPASAALGMLRGKGIRVSSERGRAPAAASGAIRSEATTAPGADGDGTAAPPRAKAASAAAQLAERLAASAAAGTRRPVPRSKGQQRVAAASGGATRASGAAPGAGDAQDPTRASAPAVAPWDDTPPDDEFVPLSAYDGAFDVGEPSFAALADDSAPDVPAAVQPPAPVDDTPLPPAVSLAPLGYDGEWPTLAASLSLRGIAYQLAFHSELMACDGDELTLRVPVPQYADAAHAGKLKAALEAALGRLVRVTVSVGPARRTAAAVEAARRAQQQQQAEREINADPFVQTLIREFGATIVPGSIRPLGVDHRASSA
ncbi:MULTISPECIES: DNA polymerase III subunit gamma/tau [Burkholderiaceae]|uniref:DNA polymerase III subunit gamma/tau n=1 Tax=Burkholderiaceae TaxID=119060 RepID=UPI00096008E1|nr:MULTISPECIES: DNA polymerase III subunit gamma/tau [Burkholderiaceae]MCG1039116.1 DNA polymerase III subunit gamma/tau [Mycetohabitans sp. B7]SIT67413.1 DNA polymerase-3 subunit gamma/tau [Burkholderia sp. b14]